MTELAGIGTSSSTGRMVANSGVATIFTTVVHDTLYAMIPWLIIAGIIVIMDLYYGVKAAKKRGEEVRSSRAIRRTVAKIFEYFCWTVMACALTVVFDAKWIDETVIAIVLATESLSLVGNALYCKGYQIRGLEDFLLKLLGKRINADTSDLHLEKEQPTNKK